MKYFEFTEDYPYYALISARSEYEAIGLYVAEVATIDDGIGEMPVEFTEEQAKAKFVDTAEEELNEIGETPEEAFERIISKSKPEVLLIDSSLI